MHVSLMALEYIWLVYFYWEIYVLCTDDTY